MGGKHRSAGKFQEERAAKVERVAGASLGELGEAKARDSAWGRAIAARREEGVDAISDGRLKEALEASMSELCQGSRAASDLLLASVSEMISAMMSPQKGEKASAWEEAVIESLIYRKALETMAREAGREGWLEEARARLSLEMEIGPGAPFFSAARELALGALDRCAQEQGLEETTRGLSAWQKDEGFWEALAGGDEGPGDLHRATVMWRGSAWGSEKAAWGEALARLAELGMRHPGAREAALGLWGRLAESAKKEEPQASWEEWGEEGGALAEALGLDEPSVKAVIAATPGAYWLGVRSALREPGKEGERNPALRELALDRAIELAAQDEGMRGRLAERLWGSLDTEGLWRWGQAQPGAPLETIEGLRLPWEKPHFALGFCLEMESEALAWARPAFEAAGLKPVASDGGGWFDASTPERARKAFEGLYALMESRDLTESVAGGQRLSRPGPSL